MGRPDPLSHPDDPEETRKVWAIRALSPAWPLEPGGLARCLAAMMPRISALDGLRAIALSEMMVQSLKYTVRQERPNHSSGYAFPSGHSADTFALATVIAGHPGFRWSLIGYAAASYAAMSRLPRKRSLLKRCGFRCRCGLYCRNNRHTSRSFELRAGPAYRTTRRWFGVFGCRPLIAEFCKKKPCTLG